MKKLMIVAAAAAMTGAVSARVNQVQYKPSAQVYDATLTVKTTACKAGKFTAALEKFDARQFYLWGNDKGDTVQFRKQASRKIAGVFWGCDCETIATPAWRVYVGYKSGKVPPPTPQNVKSLTVGGYAFWDATSMNEYIPFTIPYVDFHWALLNRIDQMTSVEGTWVLRDTANDEVLYLMGAGFGTAENASNECNSYIKTISGNFAGFLQYASGGDDGCVFCGTTDYGCLVAPFCWCLNAEDTTFLTAAFGTWDIKYNATNSKALHNAKAFNNYTSPAGNKYKTTYITEVAAYAKKPFKAHEPVSVYQAMLAEMYVILDDFCNANGLDSEEESTSPWEDDDILVGYPVDAKKRVVQEQKAYTSDEVYGLRNDYFTLVDQTDPEMVSEDDVPAFAWVLLNAS